MKKDSLKLLNNQEIIKWCYEGITDVSLKNTSNAEKLKASKKKEDEWGDKVVGGNGGGQWTTVLCQDLVIEALSC